MNIGISHFAIFNCREITVCNCRDTIAPKVNKQNGRPGIQEDQYQFILHHHVMTKQTDDRIAVDMVTEARKCFPTLNACSFDKGFHSPANQAELAQQLDHVTLPKKGKLSRERKVVEQSEEFIKTRCAHSAVESAINALEVHGLNKCPDHNIEGFERYVPWPLSPEISTVSAIYYGSRMWHVHAERTHANKNTGKQPETFERRNHWTALALCRNSGFPTNISLKTQMEVFLTASSHHTLP